MPGAWVSDAIRSRLDRTMAAETQKELYKGGTPKWISHPEDYREMANEDYLASKEQSDSDARQYQLEDQELFVNREARMINRMWTRDFIKKLRDNGVRCFTHQTPPEPGIPAWLANTTGLYAIVPRQEGKGFQKICNLRIPAMFEWSIILTDRHGLQTAHIIGWRTPLSQLITRKVLAEQKAHQIFGAPKGFTSRRYRRTLYEFRNGRLKNDDGKHLDLAQ